MLVPSVGVLRKAHPAVRELEHRRLLFSVSDLEREGETFFKPSQATTVLLNALMFLSCEPTSFA